MREMHAAELMTPDPIVVEPETAIRDVAREMAEHDVGILPVVEDRRTRRLVGVITDRDVAVRCTARGHSPAECTAATHMTRETVAARVGDELVHVMRQMQGAQVRRIPVVGDDGRILGVIAQADLAVDAVDEDAASELDVAYTLHRISEPAHPERK